MNYGYYPGCSLEGISSEYDQSLRNLFSRLEVTLTDLQDWICCGTLAAPSISRVLGLATPLWNVVRAREQGLENLVAPCSACLYHFKNAALQIEEDDTLRSKVKEVLDLPLTSLPPVIHPLQVLIEGPFEERIRQGVQRDLSGLKVVCYYGCHISRPARVMQFDDPENPTSMDNLLGWIGVGSLDWAGKVDCCGAHFSLIRPDIVVDLGARLFAAAQEVGAQAIVVACPMCHANLDTRQDEISTRLGINLDLPVLYFSQLLGYALGLPEEDLGFKKHLVDPVPLLCQFQLTREPVPEGYQEAAR